MVMRLLDLFSGIGGFSYAAEKLVGGYETVAFCEQDEFCQQVLRKHWKDVPIYDDVRTIDATRLGTIDIVAGGFPCQAVSQAGLQKATEDDRWLWDEMLRIIQDCKPRWVIGENVVGLININQGILFEQVQTDLEKEGYSVQSVVIPACAKNAPHRRDRVWIIANTKRMGWTERAEIRETSERERWADNSSNSSSTVTETSKKHRRGNSERRMGYMADGISEALSGHFSEEPKDIPRVATNQKDRTKKLKALGNSIVPQVVAELFYAIRIAEYGE